MKTTGVPYIVQFVAMVTGHAEFRNYIPNGYSVKNPCSNESIWEAVGHMTAIYTSLERNVFGEDFEKNGLQWTISLCIEDSDGDGLTNGDELGDPYCQWHPGQVPLGPPIGHPGFCEKNRTDCGVKMAELNCFEDDSGDEESEFVGNGFEWIGGSDVVGGVDVVESEDETRRNSKNNLTIGRLYSDSNLVLPSDTEHTPKSSGNGLSLDVIVIFKFVGAKFQMLLIPMLLITGNS